MVKSFYKRKKIPKVFFDPKMQVRSLAYGQEVAAQFRAWEEYFFSKWGTGSGRFVISAQGNILGSDYAVGGPKADKTAPEHSSSILPPMLIDAVTYVVHSDGWVYSDGKKTALNIGSELKAWAIATIPTGGGVKNAIFAIGKPMGLTEMKLTCYEVSKLGPTGKVLCSAPYEASLDRVSYIICLGRHIFTVHNSRLDYLYYNIEENELETVAIGADGDNSGFAYCQYVSHHIVANKAGWVFWMAGRDIYGFPIGYPRRLTHIECSDREEPIGIRADGASLLVYSKDRNTHSICCYRYVDVGGRYECKQAIQGTARDGFTRR